MADYGITRRKALAGIGGVAVLGGATVASDAGSLLGGGWTTADTDTTETLHDVARTASTPFAVGTGGRVLERGSDGGWSTVVEDGPDGDGRDLFAADATGDGAQLWFAGASGALGAYDVETGEVTPHDPADIEDYSAPTDRTGNFDGLAVTGDAGDAHVYVTDQSGHIFTSHDGGETWSDTTPGSGATIPAIEFRSERAGHLCDTDGTVFATTDGETYEQIGIEDADVSYYGLASDGSDDVIVVGGGGTVRTYNGTAWEEASVGDPRLNDVTTASGRVAVGAGGAIFEADGEWSEATTPTDENLHAVVGGDRAIAVGASGTVVEK